MARTVFSERPSRVVNSFHFCPSKFARPFCVPAQSCPSRLSNSAKISGPRISAPGARNKMIGLEQKQSVIPRAGPDPLLVIHQHFPGGLVLADGEILHGIGRPMRHAERPESHPQTAGRVLGQRLSRPRLQFSRSVKDFSFDPVQTAAVRSHPKIALVIQAQRKDIGRGQTLFRRNVPAFSVRLIPENSRAQRADNQIAVLVFARGRDDCVPPRTRPKILFELVVSIFERPR